MLTILSPVPPFVPREREWPARSLSLALHLGLIALAVWWTQAARVPSEAREHPGIPITWTLQPPRTRAPAPRAPATPALPGPATSAPLAIPAVPPVEIPPPAAAAAWWVAPLPGPPGAASADLPVGPPSPAVAPPMDVRLVEEPPVLLSHPVPGYPELLRRAGIEGRVTVEVVIDTAGRAERASLRVVASTQALLVPEATALVLGSRYRPARFGGGPVRVRIQVPVTFALRR